MNKDTKKQIEDLCLELIGMNRYHAYHVDFYKKYYIVILIQYRKGGENRRPIINSTKYISMRLKHVLIEKLNQMIKEAK
jgi:hypothetical protein